ncbi:MAG: ABC transporter permease subunit, partial [Chloroflexi bacterium]|nr:ABC transporter permease subunit [Chloroflexota bacterium]
MTTDTRSAVEVAGAPAASGRTAAGPGRSRKLRGAIAPYLGVVPFFVYIGIFLLWPTYVVLVGAFQGPGGKPTLDNFHGISSAVYLTEFKRSVEVALTTALIGAICGALLTWAVASRSRTGILRQVIIAASGVLAQFGGVTLTFAFLATFGFTGMFTVFLQTHLGIDLFAGGAWLYEIPGLALVYTYFQIPLMVIVFLPAMDGLRPQWREASETLGGTSWTYWRRVAGPILAPAFVGAVLLLFANAFSAYATAAALISQGDPIITLKIADLLTSEVNLNQQNLAQALSFTMVVVVAVIMTLYALLQRRTSR